MPTIVQTFQGRVTGLWGHASIRGADGKMHPLKLGDVIHQGDVILTTQDGIVRLSPEGSTIELAGGPAGANKPAVDEIDRVISALNDADPQAATAAGVSGGDGGGDLTPGLRVDRISEGLTPSTLLSGATDDATRASARDLAAANAQTPAQPNSSPIAVNDSASTAINTPLTVAVLANDSDRDGHPLTLTGATLANPAQGTVAVNADGTLTFTPAANLSGSVAITYTVSDGHGGSASATMTVAVGSNTVPAGADAARTLVEDGSYTVAVSDFGYVDPDAGQTFAAVQITTIPAAGALLLDGVAVQAGAIIPVAEIAAGHLTFVPVANGNGAPYASFGFSVQDSAGAFDQAPNTINFSVTPVNDAPVARNDLASTAINTPATIAVLANDGDVDGDTLTVTGATLSDPALGSVTVNPDGTLGFTPASNVSGSVVINYSIVDPSGATSTATVTVDVGNNTPPAGADASVTLAEDTSRSFAPADFGYSDADAGQTLANVRIDTLPANGALTFNGVAVVAGQVIAASDLSQLVFTPAPNANGNAYAEFTFSVQDSAGAFDPVPNALTLNVTPVNDAPVANADTGTATEDTPLAGNLLANDTDIDGDTLTVTQFSVGGATYAAGSTAALAGVGTLQINADGSYAFTPAANYHGPVPQTSYTISDGSSTSVATFSLSVDSVNDTPVAQNDLASTPINTALANISVLGNDGDVDGDTLSVTSAALANPALGAVSVNPDGTLNFTPASNVSGPVVVDYTISDGHGGTASAALTINVGANTAPAGTDAVVTIAEDTSKTFSAADFGYADADAGQSMANVRIDTLPAAGTLTFNGVAVTAGQVLAAGDLAQLVFTPAANANGNGYAAFTFSVQDSAGAFDPVPNTMSVDVTPVADGFTDADELVSVGEDTTLAGSVLTGTSSVDGAVSVTQFVVGATTYAAGATATIAGVGSLTIAADGGYSFTPAANYNGPVPIATYTVSDGTSTDTSTLAISVTPVTDGFADADEVVSLNEDAALTGSVLTGTSSVDGPVSVTQFVVGATTYAAGATATLVGVGSLTIAADGSYSFTPAANYNGPVPVATYTVSDGTTADTSTLTIAVAPMADPALISGVAGGATVEDATLVATGKLDVADPDAGEAAFQAQTNLAGAHGTFSIDAGGNWTYTLNNADPAVQALGQGQTLPNEVFTVRSVDGTTANITVTITGTDDAPVISTGSGAVTENTAPSATGTLTATDVDNPALAFVPATISGGYGSLTVLANGQWTYTLDSRAEPLAQNQVVNEPITVQLTDGSTTTVTITVTGTNDAAVITGTASGTVTEDATLIASGSLAVTDVDSPATFTPQTVSLTYGNFAIDAAGAWTYTLRNTDANVQALTSSQHPVETVMVTTADGTQQQIAITVNGANEAPTAIATPASGSEDAAGISITLSGSDVDGALASFTVTTLPLNGTLFYAGNPITAGMVIPASANSASLSFVPSANWNGSTSLSFSATDNEGASSAPVTQSITVAAVNDAPVALNDTFTTSEDTPVTFSVLGNDSDVDGDTLAITQIDGTAIAVGASVNVAGGSVTLNANGTLTFSPALNYNGSPSFTYTVSDGTLTSTATVNGNVSSVNDAPSAVADAATAVEAGGLANGTPGTNPSGNVLTNDTDPDSGDTQAVSAVSGAAAGTVGGATAGSYGTLVLNADGSYSYTVDNSNANVQALRTAGDTLTDTFSYTVRDAAGATSSTTLTVTIHGANDAPVAMADTGAIGEGATLNVSAAGGVLSNDTDVDAGDTKTVSAVSFGATTVTVGSVLTGTYGTLTLNADGSYSYQATQPAATALAQGQTATESFSYTMVDVAGTASTSTLSFTVTGANNAPTAAADINTVAEDTPLVVSASPTTGLLANDSDPDAGTSLSITQFSIAGDPTSYAAGSTAAIAGVGTLTIGANGSYSFTPAANYNGAVPVATYTVSDGITTAQSTLTLSVAPVNDAPVLSLDFDHSHNTVAVEAISGLFNTGQSASGTANALGTVDAHYSVVSMPSGSTLTNVSTQLSYAAWIANDADSTWIGSAADQRTGVYQYQTSFTLQAGADARSAHISFDLASDNNLRDILVNGVSTGFSSNLQYGAYTHVDLFGANAAFQNGLNTITFVVDNRDNASPTLSGPTGLRIDNIAGTVAVVTPDAVTHQGDYAAVYVEGTPVSIADSDVRIQDVDNTTLQGATITLTNPQAGDVLQITALPAGITASVNAAGTLVTLSGSGTLATYEAAIRAVQFNSTSDSPSGAIDRLVTVVVTDGSASSNTATTTIHVVPVDSAPALDLDGNNSTAAGTGYSGTFVENGGGAAIVDTDNAILDSDSTTLHSATIHITNVQAGDVLSATALPGGISAAVYDPVGGVLTLSGTASIADYRTALAGISFSNTSDTPNTAARTIEITVNDGNANSNVAVSTINVVATNDAPTANADIGSGIEDAVQTGSVLANDTDPDSASLSVTQFSIGASTYAAGTSATIAGVGTLVIAANGSYTFTPAADWNGTVPTVNYTTSDGALTSSSTLTLSVTAVADAVGDAVATNEDTAIVFNPITGTNETSGADNFESAGRTLTAVGTPSHGTVSFTAAGNITYTPAANYNGPDSFTYTVTSGGATETATINVNVAPVNDAPVVGSSSVRVSEEGLSGANADSTGATDTTNLKTASGSISVSDLDNATLTVTLQAPATALTSGGTAITWQSSNGGHTLTGSAGSATIITASINDSGNYTVTLSGPVDHADTSTEDLKSFGITVNVSDGSLSSTGTLTVGIEDDSPVIGTPAGAILYLGAGTAAEGDLHLSIGADSGSTAKVVFAGTSVDASGFITGNRVDQSGTVVGSGFLTYNGSKLHYVSGSDGSLSAVDASNTVVYTVTGDVASGHYDVTMLHALDPVQVTTAVFGSVTAGNNGTYSFSDGSNTFDLAATGHASDGTVSTVNTNASTFGVANNFVDGGERLTLDISAHGSGNPSHVTAIGFTAQGLGSGESLTWSAYDSSHNLVGQGVVNGSGNNSTNDATVNLSSSSFSGGSFSSIEFGGTAGTSYKLHLDSLVGNSELLQQTTNVAVHGTDGDGDTSATQTVALTFNPNTTLTGTSGEDALAGGSLNDSLNGGAGSDLLIGGKGSDTLTGGAGADVFKWSLADQGTNAAKAADTVTDFDNSPTGDKIDLRDLLVGDHSDQGNLANFLHFSVSGGSTKIEISSSGGFTGGTYSAAAVDQTITLSGVDLKGSFTNDNQIINDLITRNKLVVDH